MNFDDVINISSIGMLLDDAPAMIAFLRGPDHIFEYANKLYLSVVNRTSNIIGMKVKEALPEIASQGIIEILDKVYQSGEPFKIDEIKVDIDIQQKGSPEEMYFNLIYTPVKAAEKVVGIFVHALDITNIIKERIAAEKIKDELLYAQEKLRTAIEVANLGTWERDLVNGRLEMNQSLIDWRGLRGTKGNDASIESALVNSPDKDRVTNHMEAAMREGSDGFIDIEYDMVHPETGVVKRLRSQGRVFFNEEKKPVLMTGITHDMTSQRVAEADLAEKIAFKTTELADVNKDLVKVNENLEQFVYIASHDLQEPLRKINVFTDMLLKSNAGLTDDGKNYLSKIEKAAKRMSLLINNLLEFSQVSSAENKFTPVDLNRMISDIRIDYELLMKQKNAIINIDVLPVIEAVPLQMNQLFYNLIGNALKFAKENLPAVISISCRMASPSEVRDFRLNANFTYCNISVQDNGIGFDQQYAQKIFELFQRLHGKQEYAGTGIGLSLAKKIADSHGGTITASSKENEGAIFNVILPVTRNHFSAAHTDQ